MVKVMTQLIVLLLIVAVGYAGYEIHKRRSRFRGRLDARKRIPVQQIENRFFGDLNLDSKTFRQMWTEIAEAFGVPADAMRPDDRFGIELPCDSFLGMNDEDLMLGDIFERYAETRPSQASQLEVKTVGEFVSLISNLRGTRTGTEDMCQIPPAKPGA